MAAVRKLPYSTHLYDPKIEVTLKRLGVTHVQATRWLNCGKRAGLLTLGQYLSMHIDDMLSITNFGPKMLEITQLMLSEGAIVPNYDKYVQDALNLMRKAIALLENEGYTDTGTWGPPVARETQDLDMETVGQAIQRLTEWHKERV